MFNFFSYPDTIFSKIILLLSSSIVFITVLFIISDNPFSNYNSSESVKVERKFNFEKVKFDLYTDRSKKAYKIESNINSNLSGAIVYIKKIKNNKTPHEVLVLRGDIADYVPIKHLIDFDVHPLKPFYIHKNGSLLLLGTTSQGKDFLSKLIHSGKGTIWVIFCGLVSFIIFGIIFGVIIGYYGGQRAYISSMVRLVMKIIQSTPLLLWIFLSVIFVSLFSTLEPQNEYRVIFILVGLFSSPALGQLITNRIKVLRSEDFIITLKLLGVKNYRIIFAHILRHYCLSDILFQGSYICVQMIFLDFTLSVLEYGYPNTWGSDLWNYFHDPFHFHLFIQLLVVFTFTAFFFHLSKFLEERGQT